MKSVLGVIVLLLGAAFSQSALAAGDCKAQLACIVDLTTNDDEIHVKNTCSFPIVVQWIAADNGGAQGVYETEQIKPGYDESRLCMASMNCSKMLGWKVQGC